MKTVDNCPSPRYIREYFCDWFDPCPSVPAFNGLKIPWKKLNFVNPPYSNKIPWLKKAREEQLLGHSSMFLLPSATGANWFHDLIIPFAYVMFLKRRLKLDNGHHPRFDSMFCYFPALDK